MQKGPSKNPLTAIQLEEAKKHTDFIKILRITQHTPYGLSEELWLHILSYLTPQATLHVKKTDVFFNRLANDFELWKMHIDCYFPYLKTTHTHEYAENPYKLFFDEVLRHLEVEEIQSIPLQFLLLALKGSLAPIEESTLSEQEKKILYLYAASNNHFTVLARLAPNDKGQAFIRACQRGYLAAAQSLLSQCEADITSNIKGRALQAAIKYGHLNVVTWLLQFANQIPDPLKTACTLQAAEHNQLVIFQSLLTAMPDYVAFHKKSCFEIAARSNTFSVATCLLEQFERETLSFSQAEIDLFISAAKGNEIYLVQLLLEYRGTHSPREINALEQAVWSAVETDNLPLIKILCSHGPAESTRFAFLAASEKGKYAIAHEVFERYGANLNAENKGRALYAAARGHQSTFILTWLLDEFGTPSLKRLLPRGFQWLSAFGSSSWMQWFFHKTAGTLSRKAKEDALIAAAKEGNVSTLQFLLSHLEDDLPSQHKCDALKASAEAGNLETLQYLLEQCSPAYFAASLKKNMLWSILEHLTLLPEGFLERRATKMSAEIKEASLKLAAENNHYKVVIWLITEYKNVLSLDAKIRALKSFIYPHYAEMDEFLDIIDTELSDTQRGELLAYAANFNKPATVQWLLERWNARIITFYKKEAMRNALALNNNRAKMELLSQYCDKEIFDLAKTYVPLQTAAVSSSAQGIRPTPEANEPHLRVTLS